MAASPNFLRFEPAESSLRIHCQATIAPHQIDMACMKEQIQALLVENDCQEVVFDLGELQILSSRFLALMAAVPQLGVPVWVDSPSPKIVELLKLTRYDAVINVRQPVS